MHVRYIGPFAQPTEDGEDMHKSMLFLLRAGIGLEIEPIADCNTDDLDEEYHELLPFVRPNQDKQVTHVVIHATPQQAMCLWHEETAKAERGVLVDDYERAEQALDDEQAAHSRNPRTPVLLVVSKTTQEGELLAALRTWEAASYFRFIVIPKILDKERKWTFEGSYEDVRYVFNRVRRNYWPNTVYHLLKEGP